MLIHSEDKFDMRFDEKTIYIYECIKKKAPRVSIKLNTQKEKISSDKNGRKKESKNDCQNSE